MIERVNTGGIFAESLMVWLVELGFTDCFYVAGGNSMHLLKYAHQNFSTVAFNHEASAGIAVEHFNLVATDRQAFALVTTGPGLTNLMTPVVSSWVESRSLVVVCGAVKSSDLKMSSRIRQRGIQEASAREVFGNFSKEVLDLQAPCSEERFKGVVNKANSGRKGPVIVEVPIDIQGGPVRTEIDGFSTSASNPPPASVGIQEDSLTRDLLVDFKRASRPSLLIGGGVDRSFFVRNLPRFNQLGIPIFSSWNSADYIGPDQRIYAGRPDNFGQRSANLLINQSDFILAVGTRLSLQLTGFNWKEFAKSARIAQVDIDDAELAKEHPSRDWRVRADGASFLSALLSELEGSAGPSSWLEYCQKVRRDLQGEADSGESTLSRMSPQNVVKSIQEIAPHDTIFVPSSSGTAEIAVMQGLEIGLNQRLIVSKGLASMGYGLPGAIGCALANPDRPIYCIEGDGSLAQSLSELPMILARGLNITLVVIDNGGYASIRATQKRFLGAASLGTDDSSGLYLPDYVRLATGLGFHAVAVETLPGLREQLEKTKTARDPWVLVARVQDASPPLPRVSADLHDDGKLISRPSWDMDPQLPKKLFIKVSKYLETEEVA